MTEQDFQQMTDEQALNLLVASRVGSIVTEEQERMFERFDQLHTKGIDDSQIIRALRHNDDDRLAEDYIEWADCIDPDADGAPRGIVIDNVNDSSYKALEQERLARRIVDEMRRQADTSASDGPYVRDDSLNDVLIDGHVDLLALARAILTKEAGK